MYNRYVKLTLTVIKKETDWITIVNDYFDKKFPKHCMFMQICSSTSQLGVALLLSKKQQLDTGMPGPICFGLLFFQVFVLNLIKI